MDATRSPELLRVPEAAERLNVSPASIYRWIDEGRLPAVQLGGRGSPLRVPADELERWLTVSQVTPAERRAPNESGQSIVPAHKGPARSERDEGELQ